MTMPIAFTTGQVAKLTGLSVETVKKWVKTDFIPPSGASGMGRGSSTLYTFRDLVAYRVAGHLRYEAGVSLEKLRRVVDYLQQRKGLTASEVLASTHLVSDGHDVYEIDGNVAISTLLKPGQTTLCIVPLGKLVRELHDQASQLAA